MNSPRLRTAYSPLFAWEDCTFVNQFVTRSGLGHPDNFFLEGACAGAVPGPGWIDFDPSSGMVGNQNLVRVAVVHEPREAIPLQGTWIGTASDHLAMKVAVKVTGECPRRGHVGRCYE